MPFSKHFYVPLNVQAWVSNTKTNICSAGKKKVKPHKRGCCCLRRTAVWTYVKEEFHSAVDPPFKRMTSKVLFWIVANNDRGASRKNSLLCHFCYIVITLGLTVRQVVNGGATLNRMFLIYLLPYCFTWIVIDCHEAFQLTSFFLKSTFCCYGSQNRRHKVFNRGFYVCAGRLDILTF